MNGMACMGYLLGTMEIPRFRNLFSCKKIYYTMHLCGRNKMEPKKRHHILLLCTCTWSGPYCPESIDFRVGAHAEIRIKAPLNSLKMREIPIFAKTRHLANHMGREGISQNTSISQWAASIGHEKLCWKIVPFSRVLFCLRSQGCFERCDQW